MEGSGCGISYYPICMLLLENKQFLLICWLRYRFHFSIDHATVYALFNNFTEDSLEKDYFAAICESWFC